MFIKCLKVGPLEANCYILCDKLENKAAIIDPGFEAARILTALEDTQCKAEYVILTHGHFDHMAAAGEVLNKTGAALVLYENELELLNNPIMSLYGVYMPKAFVPLYPGILLSDGDTLSLGRLELKIIHTPGHTSGSCCIICQDDIFTGDTLFRDGVGRTDFPTGDIGALRASLRKLGALNGEYQLLPGHGEFSTLSYERENNSEVGGDR